jgi:nucleoside-diphosphate-sugar epimerase
MVRKLVPGATIVRPPVVYGPRDTDVYQILKSIARGLVLEISGGERWFSAIFVQDLVDGILAAVGTPKAAGRTYFLAHPKPVSWTNLREAAERIIGRRPRVVCVPMAAAQAVAWGAEVWSKIQRKPGIISREKVREAEARWWTCDTTRAAVDLDFHAPTDMDTGMARTLAWYKEAGWLHY